MTIVDIAKEAGYSVSTVSRVLNGRRVVLMAAAKEYKCAPFMISDKIAQALAENELFESVESVKPGFINMKVSPAYLAKYPERLLKSGYSWVLTVNPVYNVIINVRNIIFHEAFNWGCMTYACVFALVSVVVGVIVFHKNQDKFILYI